MIEQFLKWWVTIPWKFVNGLPGGLETWVCRKGFGDCHIWQAVL